MASRIHPADLNKMMGVHPRSTKTIVKGKKKKTIRQPVVRRKRKGTKGLLRPKGK